MMLKSLAVLPAFCLAIAWIDPVHADETYDCSFSVPLNRPLHALRIADFDLSASVGKGAIQRPLELKGKSELEFVEETLELSRTTEKTRRRYLRSEDTNNGEASDPPYTALHVEYRRDEKQSEWEMLDGRTVYEPHLTRIGRLGYCTGLWLPLPKEAKVGQSYKVDASTLAPMLVTEELDIDAANSLLELKSFVDGEATFGVKLKISQSGTLEEPGVDVKQIYRFVGTMKVRPGEGRLSELKLRGKVEGESAEGAALDLSLKGTVNVELTTTVGPDAATAAKRKPKARKNLLRVPHTGVQFELPAYYQKLPGAEENIAMFIRTRDIEKGLCVISVFPQALPAAAEPEFEKGVTESGKKGKFAAVRAPLGKGRGVRFTHADGDGDKQMMRIEYFRTSPQHIAIYRIHGAPAAVKAAAREFQSARKTLRKITPIPGLK